MENWANTFFSPNSDWVGPIVNECSDMSRWLSWDAEGKVGSDVQFAESSWLHTLVQNGHPRLS
jgi:hypothetical protein